MSDHKFKLAVKLSQFRKLFYIITLFFFKWPLKMREMSPSLPGVGCLIGPKHQIHITCRCPCASGLSPSIAAYPQFVLGTDSNPLPKVLSKATKLVPCWIMVCLHPDIDTTDSLTNFYEKTAKANLKEISQIIKSHSPELCWILEIPLDL